MTLLYCARLFQQHLTGAHPEHPGRLAAIGSALDERGLRSRCGQPEWQPASAAEISRVHDPRYVQQIEQFAASGGGRIEADTVLSEQSFEVARLASGAVCDAVRRVLAGED